MVTRFQYAALTAGLIAHLVFWSYFLAESEWAIGEYNYWVLVIWEMPASKLYAGGPGPLLKWGSLFVGSAWWGIVASGLTNLALLAAVPFGSRIRTAFAVSMRAKRASLHVAWFVATIASVPVALSYLWPFLLAWLRGSFSG
jgi:hypothetical protein